MVPSAHTATNNNDFYNAYVIQEGASLQEILVIWANLPKLRVKKCQKTTQKRQYKRLYRHTCIWIAVKSFLNNVLLQIVTKTIYQVSIGQISALWSKYFISFVLISVGRGVKNSNFQALSAPT